MAVGGVVGILVGFFGAMLMSGAAAVAGGGDGIEGVLCGGVGFGLVGGVLGFWVGRKMAKGMSAPPPD
jgi:hypothetical protein